jgi:hypothetical protein
MNWHCLTESQRREAVYDYSDEGYTRKAIARKLRAPLSEITRICKGRAFAEREPRIPARRVVGDAQVPVISVTARLMGDPPPGRSALDMKRSGQ